MFTGENASKLLT